MQNRVQMKESKCAKDILKCANEKRREKLLPQFDCTTCLEMCCGRVVLTISEVKPFLAGQLCQVNFQNFSSLTMVTEWCYIKINLRDTQNIHFMRIN